MMGRFKIILGKVIYCSLGSILPVAHCRIRILGEMGKAVRAWSGKLILYKCGSNVNIYPRANFSTMVELGDNADIGLKCKIYGKCVIGDNVIIGPEVLVYTTNHETKRTDIAIKYQGTTEMRPVYIGEDSWIGTRVIILPGVKIGKGCVIGAGAVVSKDIPDYAVAVGNPAKVVKFRNTKEES